MIKNDRVSKASRLAVWRREFGKCEGCDIPVNLEDFHCHHIYYRSKYKKDDRHEPWNLACFANERVCKCHEKAHASKAKRAALEKQADARKPKNERSTDSVKQKKPKSTKVMPARKYGFFHNPLSKGK